MRDKKKEQQIRKLLNKPEYWVPRLTLIAKELDLKVGRVHYFVNNNYSWPKIASAKKTNYVKQKDIKKLVLDSSIGECNGIIRVDKYKFLEEVRKLRLRP